MLKKKTIVQKSYHRNDARIFPRVHSIVRSVLTFLFVPLVMLLAFQDIAEAGINITRQEAQFAESGISECAQQFQGKQLRVCVGNKLNEFASGLQQGDVPKLSPKASGTVRSAAAKIKSASSKTRALSVVNRTRSILRGLAAKTSGQSRAIYKRIGLVFNRAKSVIRRKG